MPTVTKERKVPVSKLDAVTGLYVRAESENVVLATSVHQDRESRRNYILQLSPGEQLGQWAVSPEVPFPGPCKGAKLACQSPYGGDRESLEKLPKGLCVLGVRGPWVLLLMAWSRREGTKLWQMLTQGDSCSSSDDVTLTLAHKPTKALCQLSNNTPQFLIWTPWLCRLSIYLPPNFSQVVGVLTTAIILGVLI